MTNLETGILNVKLHSHQLHVVRSKKCATRGFMNVHPAGDVHTRQAGSGREGDSSYFVFLTAHHLQWDNA